MRMKIKLFNAVTLVLLHTGITFVGGIAVSGISCGDVCSATTGSPYTLSCVWSGSLTGGIVWSKDGPTKMTCNPDGSICLPVTTGYATASYPNATGAILIITSFNPATDSGVWKCIDSGDPSSQTCQLPSIATGTLQGTCTQSGSDHNISCSGISSLGSPAVTLELKDGSTVLASTTTAGSVSSVQTNTAGKTYSCSASGTAAVCLAPAAVDVVCPVPTTGCTSEDGCIVIIVLIVILCIVTIVMIGLTIAKPTASTSAQKKILYALLVSVVLTFVMSVAGFIFFFVTCLGTLQSCQLCIGVLVVSILGLIVGGGGTFTLNRS